MSENAIKKPELINAADNPWYQLATIGEKFEYNPLLLGGNQNAYYWNGWLRHCLEELNLYHRTRKTYEVVIDGQPHTRDWPSDRDGNPTFTVR